MHMFNVSTLYRQSIKLLHQKLWWELIGPWRHHLCIYKHIIRENCLSSHYCHFFKKKSEPNSFMHMFNVSTLYRQSIKLLHQKLWWELISPWRHHLCIYKSPIRENYLSSHSCHFVKHCFYFTQTPSWICSMCLHCIGKLSNCSIKSCCRIWSAHKGAIHAYTKVI